MPTLYRCRTALSEVAALCDASAPAAADWSGELWPNRIGLIVRATPEGRIIEAMRWNLPAPLGPPDAKAEPRTTVWFREFLRDARHLHAPSSRCLIITDSFAFPDGNDGSRTRTWYGFEDRPIFAWAGIWHHNGKQPGFCGFHAPATAPVTPGQAMPAILDPSEYRTWLEADLAEASPLVRRERIWPGLYREETEQPWGADWS